MIFTVQACAAAAGEPSCWTAVLTAAARAETSANTMTEITMEDLVCSIFITDVRERMLELGVSGKHPSRLATAGYSARSASVGLISVARRAGSQQAKTPMQARMSETAAKLIGSKGVTS